MTKSMADELPIDILFTILSKLPVKTLLRLKSVSKLFCKIIENPYLAQLHLKQGLEEPQLLIMSISYARRLQISIYEYDHHKYVNKCFEVTLDIGRDPYSSRALEGSCNGLLYFKNDWDDRVLIVFNPVTREIFSLPPEENRSHSPGWHHYGLGFDASTSTYKIVRIFYQQRESDDQCYKICAEVFTLGTNSWRETDKVSSYPLDSEPVFANGALHWIVKDSISARNEFKRKIVSFHVGKEEFNLISQPGFSPCRRLIEIRGFLGFVGYSSFRSSIEIWVMKDYDKKEWIKEYTFGIKDSNGFIDNRFTEVIGMWENGEILFKYFFSFISYNPKTNKLRIVHIPFPTNQHIKTIICHRGSLVSLSSF